MDQHKFDTYLERRYEDQIKWYDNRAARYKKLYNFFQWIVIILAVILPVLISTAPERYQFVSVVVSVILAISTTGLKTFKFQENWLNYRTTAETLKKEIYYYDAEVHDYAHTEDKEGLFVKRIESFISKENTMWESVQTKKDEGEQAESKVG
ncbi:MAG: DUF4231 domain-containing protein [bacterium]|nr:DUF4231 domain-containing protein [bacterium]